MRLLEWVQWRQGRAIDVDGVYGAQCTDLVNDYLMKVRGGGRVAGDASAFAREAVPGFRWVPNGPDNSPPIGSVVVWSGPDPIIGTSAAGHTAIAVAADSMSLLTFDQNWPTGGRPVLTWHSYRAVLGWHAPTRA